MSKTKALKLWQAYFLEAQNLGEPEIARDSTEGLRAACEIANVGIHNELGIRVAYRGQHVSVMTPSGLTWETHVATDKAPCLVRDAIEKLLGDLKAKDYWR